MDNLKNISDKMERNNETTLEIVMEGVRGLVYRQDRNTEPEYIIIFCSSNQYEINVGIEKCLHTLHVLSGLSFILFIYRLLTIKISHRYSIPG